MCCFAMRRPPSTVGQPEGGHLREGSGCRRDHNCGEPLIARRVTGPCRRFLCRVHRAATHEPFI